MIEKYTQLPVLEMLQESASEHARLSNGFFVTYEVDPDSPDFESQQLHTATTIGDERAVHTGSPIDYTEADKVASIVEKRYKSLLRSGKQDAELQTTLKNMATLMKLKPEEHDDDYPYGFNVTLGTGHEEITDILFGLVYVSNRLHELNTPHRSGIIISKALDFTGINTDILEFDDETVDAFALGLGLTVREDRSIHLLDFLSLAVDRIYRTIPDTPTFAELRGLHGAMVRGHSIGVLRRLWHDQDATVKEGISPLLLAVATSGSLTKILETEKFIATRSDVNYETLPEIPDDIGPEDYIEIAGKIAPGVLKTMKRGLVYAQGMRLRDIDDPTPSQIKIHPEFLQVHNREHLDIYSELLMKVLGELANNPIVLDMIGNLPVTRKS